VDRVEMFASARRLAARGSVLLGPWRRPSEAILFEREGALVSSVGVVDAGAIELAPGAAAAVARARAAGVSVAVVAGGGGRDVGEGEAAERVNARVSDLVGRVDAWLECPHEAGDDCFCRLPAPGLIYLAAAALGTRPERCTVVGDAHADVEAARAAGARAVLVPSARTTEAEIEAAPVVAASLDEAVAIALGRAA
jgi:histidinol-phosphate phosphatase family protein